jgi:dihydrofolate reductase
MKVSVFIATSLDGFIARENGGLDWLPGSDGQDTGDGEEFGYNAFFDSVDVLIMGRNTYEMVLSFGQWPYGDKRVIVLSRTLDKLPDDSPATVALRAGSPQELVGELEAAGAGHLYVDGGKTIHGFLEAGLIDELIITRVPILIGSGIPLFGRLGRDQRLRHVQTQTFDNGFVQSRYERIDP